MSRRGGTIFVFGDGPSRSLLGAYKNRLRHIMGIGVNQCYTLPVQGERVGGGWVTWPLLHYVFVDFDMWAFCHRHISNLACPVHCPAEFQFKEIPGGVEKENKVRREAPPIPEHFNRFSRYFPSKSSPSPLSDSWDKGLFYRNSTIFAAIGMAYLFDAEEIALLGVDLKNYAHFNEDTFKDRPYPKAEPILQDLEDLAYFLKGQGVRCWNCAPEDMSIVRGWDRKGLGAGLKHARRKMLQRLGEMASPRIVVAR